jgi:MFS family permease
VTGYLSQYGLRAPIYAAAAMSATSILCTATLLRTVRPGAGSADDAGPAGRRLGVFEWAAYVRYFRQPVLGRLLAQFLAFAFAFATFTSGFALFAERTFAWHGKPFGPREVGYLFAYAGFLGIILQGGLIGRLVERFGERPLSTAGFLAMSAAYLLLGLVDHVGPLVVVATLTAFGQGVLRPTLTSLVSRWARADEQGVVLGLTQSLGSVAQITAPPLAGWLIGHALLSEWAFVAAAAAAAGLALGVSRREASDLSGAARRAG